MMMKRPARAAQPLPEQSLPISQEYITLGQVLKMAGIIDTGGQAKYYLADTIIDVNGEPEQRRGRKLYPGDRIKAPGFPPIRIAVATEETEEEE